MKVDAIHALRRALTAERVGLSYVIQVTATTREPIKSVKVVRALTDAYVADLRAAREEVATKANRWFRDRLAEINERVAAAERASVDFRLKNQIMIAGGKFIDEQQVASLSDRLVDTQARRAIAEGKLARINALIEANRLGESGGGGVGEEISNTVIIDLLNKYHKIRLFVEENLVRYGPNHEAVIIGRRQMAEIENSVFVEFKRIAEGYKSDAAIARQEEEYLTRLIDELSKQSIGSQKARVELNILDGAAGSYRALRDGFFSEFQVANQEQTFPVSECRVLGEALPPNRPSFPVVHKTIGAGLGLGAFFGFMGGLAAELFGRRTPETRSDRRHHSPCLFRLLAARSLKIERRGRNKLDRSCNRN